MHARYPNIQTRAKPSKSVGWESSFKKVNRFRLFPSRSTLTCITESCGSGPSPCSESERSGALSSGLPSSPLAGDVILVWNKFGTMSEIFSMKQIMNFEVGQKSFFYHPGLLPLADPPKDLPPRRHQRAWKEEDSIKCLQENRRENRTHLLKLPLN